jgi:hypothetical protein
MRDGVSDVIDGVWNLPVHRVACVMHRSFPNASDAHMDRPRGEIRARHSVRFRDEQADFAMRPLLHG